MQRYFKSMYFRVTPEQYDLIEKNKHLFGGRSALLRDAVDRHLETIRQASIDQLEKDNRELRERISKNQQKISQLKKLSSDPAQLTLELTTIEGNSTAHLSHQGGNA